MKFIGNLIWLLCGGFITALEYFICGIVLMITIIGIPFGLQAIKLGILALWPFGSVVTQGSSAGGCFSTIFNIIWIFTGGLIICLTHLFWGIILCITIIGTPFGKQHFKMAGLALTPFGKNIN